MGAPKGNQNAAKNKIWEQAIQRAARPKDLEEIANAVIQAAKDGQAWAVTEIGNRLDGKPVQQVEMNGSMNMTQTYRDLTDEALLAIAAQARAKAGQGKTIQ